MTTFAYGLTQLESLGNITLVDDYLDLPARRGNNKTIPYRHGTVFNQKFYDQRTIPVGIAILGTSLSDLETKLNTIRGLFSEQTPQTLTIVFEDSSTKTALVTVDRPLQIRRTQSLARIVVEFTLCDPFFRSSTLYEVTSDAIDGTPTPQTLTVVNSGTVEERNPTMLLSGPLKNPVITNTDNAVSLTYTGTIAGGTSVTIGELNGEKYATHSGTGSVIGNVTHSGSAAFMTLDVGNNAITITDADYAGGTVKFSYYPPFL